MSKNKEITICKVVEVKRVDEYDGQNTIIKVWKIIRNDKDKSLEGLITATGLPARACNLPLGSEYKTELTVPKE